MAQLFSAKKYWGTGILRQNNTGAQLLEQKILGHKNLARAYA